MKGVFLILFSGVSSGIRSWLNKRGYAVIAFDISVSQDYDLSKRNVIDCVLGWIKAGLVAGVWLSPPCRTWSIACQPALRTRDHIWGVHHSAIASHRVPILQDGNRTLRVACRIASCCNELGVPVFLEHPESALSWHAPPLAALLRSDHCRIACASMCAFGAPWRKHGRIVCWHACIDRFHFRRCTGHHGFCSFSHKRHRVLEGRDPISNKLWATIAAKYPSRFCTAACQSLIDAAFNTCEHALITALA